MSASDGSRRAPAAPGAGRRIAAWLALLALVLVAACATLPPPDAARAVSTTLVAPPDAPLAAVAREAGASGDLSAFRPMLQAAYALDARIEMIRRARVSLDLQLYQIADDSTGRLVLRELAAAAERGVRVRVLLDDLYAEGLDELLLGFAARPNVEVRLFNPFAYGRDGSITRFWHLLTDFRRLNHRMHNKLFVADGALAIAGGRNIADEYFLRSQEANYIDFEMLMAGPVVGQLSAIFDAYWNSDQVWPLERVARPGFTPAQLREAFARIVAEAPPLAPLTAPDMFGRPPFRDELDAHRYRFVIAPGGAVADRPDKRFVDRTGQERTVAERYEAFLRDAKSEVIAVSPYFIPGRSGVALLKELRERGVTVRVVTNASSTTDEPLVSFRAARYRPELLEAGVRLYEMESARLKQDATYHDLLGRSRGRLHAKLAIIDRQLVLLGSMNLDPRSARINTEVGIAIRSRELAAQILPSFDIERIPGLLEVRLRPGQRGVQWFGHDGVGREEVETTAGSSWVQSLRLFMLSLLVAEDQL